MAQQELWSGDTRRKPIALGGALVTMVEPHRGHEVAYNRWYERDHFYAGCLVGPWLFAGRRWVATRDLKDLRFGEEPDLLGGVRRGSYLAIYWVVEGKHDEHFDWALDQVKWLHANGRMFEHRDHVTPCSTGTSGAPTPAGATCRPSSRSTTRSPGCRSR